jgi:hypothetical protein
MHTYNDHPCSACGDLDGCHIPGKVMREKPVQTKYVTIDGCMGRDQCEIGTVPVPANMARYGQSYPLMICLVGSSRFKEDHLRVMKEQTLEGNIVLPMGMFGHNEPGFDMNGPVKLMLDELHLRKIDRADVVYVVNPKVRICSMCSKPDLHIISGPTACCHHHSNVRPYIGDSTKREIAYAQSLNKKIIYMNP